MRRGTTPTLIFIIPYTKELVTGGRIIFSQRGTVFMEKEIRDAAVSVDDYIIKANLTRDETLSMTEVDKLKVQIEIDLPDGKIGVSNVMTTCVGEYIGDED